jgi:hypothetical protein
LFLQIQVHISRIRKCVLNKEKYGKLHNKELHDLYSSPIIIRIIKSRRLRWAGHVARMERRRRRRRRRRRKRIDYWWESQKERVH